MVSQHICEKLYWRSTFQVVSQYIYIYGMVINPIVQVCLFGPIFYGAFAPKNEDSFSRPNVVSLISFISSWVARWAAGLFKTTFLHIYTRDRHGDDVPERLELRTVEQVRIETSETSERVEWFRVKVFWKDWWLGQWFPQHFCRIVLPNSGVPFWRSLHTFASGSSLILSRFRMYGSLLEWGYHRSWLRR